MRFDAKFTPTVEDVITGYRMHNRLPNDVWKLYALGATGVALVFGIAAFVMRFLAVGIAGVFAAGLGFGAPMLLEWNIRRAAKKTLRPEEVRLSFSDEGVEFSSKTVQGRHTWDLITKASLDERGVLLYTGPMSYSFTPARAFALGYFPREELKALLSTKIRNA